MDDHEGPGVVPGRYPGEPIQIHGGPTPQQVEHAERRTYADVLAGRICAAAADVARSTYTLLELLGEFDAVVRSVIGLTSNRWRTGCRGRVR